MFDILTTVPEETSIPVINELYGLLLYGKLDGKPKPREEQLDKDQTDLFLSVATKLKSEDVDKYVKDLNRVFDKVTGFVESPQIEEAPKDKTTRRSGLGIGSSFKMDTYEAILWLDPSTGNNQIKNIAKSFRDVLKKEGTNQLNESNRGLRKLIKPYEGKTSVIKYVFQFSASGEIVDSLRESFVGDNRVLTLYIGKHAVLPRRRGVARAKPSKRILGLVSPRAHTHERNT